MLCRRQWCVTIRGFPTSGRQAHSRLVGRLKALFLMVAPDCKSQWFGRTGRERDDLLYDDQTTDWQRRLALMVPLPLIANHRKVERERRREKGRGRERKEEEIQLRLETGRNENEQNASLLSSFYLSTSTQQ